MHTIFERKYLKSAIVSHLSTAVAWREKSSSTLSLTNIFAWYYDYLNPKFQKKTIDGPQSYLLPGQADSAKKAGPGQAS